MSSSRARLAPSPKLEVGFPEFESFHLADFSPKAQFSKSVASTIPPRPRDRRRLRQGNTVSYSTTNRTGLQLSPPSNGITRYFSLAFI
ncbi:hypothetical protein PGN35_013365 [Nodosilinea sp. PGN35]|uniref:hypothetical protein n=1 Tax=Nodosilinea sp. PGN35 TaxID=3020489 RepID=UPI0023B2A0D2|nr:hypothetical protein [Nodosilinea sp. TSF1-S3]MDF0366189.1 hypothetical protein [Nodosilinea sp. TSF1-S3]